MSATVAAIAKKVAIYLATDKRTWKVVGMIIGIVIAIVLLPVMLLLAMGNQFSNADAQQIDYSQFVQNLSAEQQTQFSKLESDGTAIANELIKLGLKTQIVKAQMIYFTYFDSVPQDENFFADYCVCFQETDDEKLIDSLSQKYELSIDYEEFIGRAKLADSSNVLHLCSNGVRTGGFQKSWSQICRKKEKAPRIRRFPMMS